MGSLTVLTSSAAVGPRSGSGGPDTFWLGFTNIALGLAVLVACLWVAWGIVLELLSRWRSRRAAAAVSAVRAISVLVALAFAPFPAEATVEMQVEAKKLGFAIKNCLDCHATAHAVDVMHQKAKDLKMADGNCLACHGPNIPINLNGRGEWLVAEKVRRGAKECDMAWLKDYKEPTPVANPKVVKAPNAKAAARP